MPPIILISGSPSAPSKSSTLLDYTAGQLSRFGLATQLISARDFPPHDLVFANFGSPALEAARRLIAEAPAVVVATPVYKAAYSGLLKIFLDLLPQTAFRGKTVLPLATGGSAGHMLAIDYALKPVLAALAATDVLQGVYAVDTHFTTDENGRSQISEEICKRLNEAAEQLATNILGRAKG